MSCQIVTTTDIKAIVTRMRETEEKIETHSKQHPELYTPDVDKKAIAVVLDHYIEKNTTIEQIIIILRKHENNIVDTILELTPSEYNVTS